MRTHLLARNARIRELLTSPSSGLDKNATQQLLAIGELHESLEQEGLEHWLFGGWAVDFHAGRVIRPLGARG